MIGALAVVGGALLIVPGMLAPQPGGSAAPVGSQAASAAVPSLAASPYRSIAWEIVPLMGIPADARVLRVVDVGDRILAVVIEAASSSMWSSDDHGMSWNLAQIGQLAKPADGAILRTENIAVAGERLVATGMWWQGDLAGVLGAVLMVSDDAGATWRNVPLPAQLADTEFQPVIGLADLGFLAYGSDYEHGSQGWHESADGLTWGPAQLSGLSTFQPPNAAASGPAGLVAVGSLGSGNSMRPAIWTSDDGHHWEPVLEQADPPFGAVQEVVAWNEGYVAVGNAWETASTDLHDAIPTIWTSVDGQSWSSVLLSEQVGLLAGPMAANTTGTVLSLFPPALPGFTGSPAAAFVPAGSTKAVISDLPLVLGAVIATEDGFLGIGFCRDEAVCTDQYLLIGTPTEDEHPPAPILPSPGPS